jgi:hypothetical protein
MKPHGTNNIQASFSQTPRDIAVKGVLGQLEATIGRVPKLHRGDNFSVRSGADLLAFGLASLAVCRPLAMIGLLQFPVWLNHGLFPFWIVCSPGLKGSRANFGIAKHKRLAVVVSFG